MVGLVGRCEHVCRYPRRIERGCTRRRSLAVEVKAGRAVMLVSVGLLLTTSCSSPVPDTSATSASHGAMPPTAPASPAAATPTVSASGPACEDLEEVAAGIPTMVNDLAALIGTGQDPATALNALSGIAPELAPRVSACTPDVEDAMWRFLTDMEELRQKFSAGVGPIETAQSKLRLVAVSASGAQMFEGLGLRADSWAELPENARPVCRDLASVGAQMTWDVRHLANLIGSDNVTDAEGYTVEMTALTTVLADLVDQCRGRASAAMGGFREAMDAVIANFKPGSDPDTVAENKEVMGSLRAAGIALFGKLRLDDTGWKVIPTTEQ
jgi:hypothetical protein